MLAAMRMLDAIRTWPVQRRAVTLLLVVPLFLLVRAVDPASGVVFWVAGLVTATAGAMLLASYVPGPGEGRRLVIGCTPCAGMAAMTLVGALVLRASAPADGGIALATMLLPVMGVVQRLSDAGSCVVAVSPAVRDPEA
jgi:hypothetical protein